MCEKQMKNFGDIACISKKPMDSYNERIMRAIKYSDKQCQKAHIGKTPFSLEALRIMGAMKLMIWRIKLMGRVGRLRKRRLQRLAVRYGYEGDVLISDVAIVQLLINQYCRNIKHSGQRRMNSGPHILGASLTNLQWEMVSQQRRTFAISCSKKKQKTTLNALNQRNKFMEAVSQRWKKILMENAQ